MTRAESVVGRNERERCKLGGSRGRERKEEVAAAAGSND